MILHEKEIDKNILKDAFKKTSRHRSSFENIKNNGTEYIQMIEESKTLSKLWEQYKSKNNYASDVKWDDAIKSVKKTYQAII
jgi:L-rhamnose isomerase